MQVLYVTIIIIIVIIIIIIIIIIITFRDFRETGFAKAQLFGEILRHFGSEGVLVGFVKKWITIHQRTDLFRVFLFL